jgi:hypothetical protein
VAAAAACAAAQQLAVAALYQFALQLVPSAHGHNITGQLLLVNNI